jgi:hypothetical protein
MVPGNLACLWHHAQQRVDVILEPEKPPGKDTDHKQRCGDTDADP